MKIKEDAKVFINFCNENKSTVRIAPVESLHPSMCVIDLTQGCKLFFITFKRNMSSFPETGSNHSESFLPEAQKVH